MQNPISKLTMATATVGATLLALLAVSAPANAETQYLFNKADFNTTVNVISRQSGILDVVVQGSSTNAPFGLTQFFGPNYTQLDFTTGQITFNTDPAAFGLQADPGYIMFSGTGSDSSNAIFGTASGTGTGFFDFNSMTGEQTSNSMFNSTAIITGGEGIFSGATGQLTFSFSGKALPSTTPSFGGDLLVSGSFTTPTATVSEPVPVPEPVPVTPLADIGLGAAILLHWRLRRGSISELQK